LKFLVFYADPRFRARKIARGVFAGFVTPAAGPILQPFQGDEESSR
jgi:hypothetical protein